MMSANSKRTQSKLLKTKFFYHNYEKKFTKMEKETPDEMEMAEKKTQKGKAQKKSKKRESQVSIFLRIIIYIKNVIFSE